MRRIVVALLSTVTALVLLFSYHTSTNRSAGVAVAASPAEGSADTTTDGTTDDTTDDTTDGTTDDTTAAADVPTDESATVEAPAATATDAPAAAAQTFTGGVAQTRWGPVQVEITIENGTITAADAVQYPTGHESDEINAYAVPILNEATLSAQSTDIETISGATITSEGYRASLQSALDAAAAAGVTVAG